MFACGERGLTNESMRSTIRVIVRALMLLCIATAGIVLTPQIGAAGRQDTVKLKGVVLDPQDARIVRASITLENDKLKRVVYSNEEGSFEAQLPAGVYQLTVESNGFKKLHTKALQVKYDDVDDLTIHLEPEPPGIHLYFPDYSLIEPENSPLPEKINPRKIN